MPRVLPGETARGKSKESREKAVRQKAKASATKQRREKAVASYTEGQARIGKQAQEDRAPVRARKDQYSVWIDPELKGEGIETAVKHINRLLGRDVVGVTEDFEAADVHIRYAPEGYEYGGEAEDLTFEYGEPEKRYRFAGPVLQEISKAPGDYILLNPAFKRYYYPQDKRDLVAHEIGHGLGLWHTGEAPHARGTGIATIGFRQFWDPKLKKMVIRRTMNIMDYGWYGPETEQVLSPSQRKFIMEAWQAGGYGPPPPSWALRKPIRRRFSLEAPVKPPLERHEFPTVEDWPPVRRA